MHVFDDGMLFSKSCILTNYYVLCTVMYNVHFSFCQMCMHVQLGLHKQSLLNYTNPLKITMLMFSGKSP